MCYLFDIFIVFTICVDSSPSRNEIIENFDQVFHFLLIECTIQEKGPYAGKEIPDQSGIPCDQGLH